MKTYIFTLDRLLQQNDIQIKFILYAHKQNIHQSSVNPIFKYNAYIHAFTALLCTS